MDRCRTLMVLLAVVAVSPGICQLSTSVSLAYDFEPGVEVESHISAKLLGLNMGGGIPVAVSGGADVDLTIQVLEVDAEAVATIKLSFGKLTSEFMGESREKDDLQPITMKLDRHGHVLEAQGVEGIKFDLFAGGGIPIPIIATLGSTVELADEALPLGETWTATRTSEVPDLGEVTLTTTSRLDSLDSEHAVIVTTIQGDLPDFTAKNPIQEGEIEIKNPHLAIENMTRTVNLSTGIVETADAEITFTCTANIGGMGELPITLTSSFELRPKGEQEQARGDVRPERPAQRTAQVPQPNAQPAAPATYERTTQAIAHYLGALLSNALAWWQAR